MSIPGDYIKYGCLVLIKGFEIIKDDKFEELETNIGGTFISYG